MAKEKIVMGINLRQNKNSKNAASYGKYYPEVAVQPTLSTRGFAQHMVDHGSLFSRNVVEGVLNQICECLPELMAQAVPVQLGSLGTFYPTAEVEEGKGVATIAEMEGLSASDIVKAIHIRFLPDMSKLDNLSGKVFKESCELELRNIVDTTEVTVNGKKRKLQTLKPIATAIAESRAGAGLEDDDEEENNQGGTTGGGDNNSGGGENQGGGGVTPVTPEGGGGEENG